MYEIQILRDDKVIYTEPVSSDDVIRYLTEGVFQDKKVKVAKAEKPKKERVVKEKRHNKCSRCSQVGHKRSNCPMADDQKPMVEPDNARGDFAGGRKEIGAVSATTFIQIRAAKEDGVSPKNISEREGLTLAQVSAVLEASSYERYRERFAH